MPDAESLPLDDVLAGRGNVEQQVDQMVLEQVDLVDVQESAVGPCEQARLEDLLAVGERALEVKCAALDDPVGNLSGGNQQKVVLAKWLATRPSLLIIDEPTRGIDVGTKSEVHRMMSELAGMGLAILMISSELPEVLGMADRVLVMHEGRITADIPRSDATPESVMFAATHDTEDPA